MDLVDPYIRTLSSPISTADRPTETPASLLRTARWHAGLSQADVAQRAQTSQPVVARYETGARTPTLDVLRNLLATCGMRLDLALAPEPGLVDAPTRALLSRTPWERLPEEFQQMLAELVPLLRRLGLPVLVADRAAARIRGALVRVVDLELWVDDADVVVGALVEALEGIGAHLWPCKMRPDPGTGRVPRLKLLEGGLRGREIRVRGMRNFAQYLAGAARIDLPIGPVLITAASDTTLYWPPRDRDRLALQRAEALLRELQGPPPL